MASYSPDDIWADAALDLSLYRLMPISAIEMDFLIDSEILKMAFYCGALSIGREILILTEESGLTDSKIV